VKVVVLSRDLIIASRILGRATAAGHDAQLIGEPSSLPAAGSVDLLFVNWADRIRTWGNDLQTWRVDAPPSGGPRVVLFGPHSDLAAHADARAAGLGPMWARSKLVAELPSMLSARGSPPGRE
jgi:hypothetical protein